MASTYEPIEYDIGQVRELFDSCIIIGTVASVDHDTNKASVTTDDWGTISDIPIHYHCLDKETVDDGHLAFEEDDEVYVLHDGSSFPPSVSTMKIVGRVEGLKICEKCDPAAVIGYTTLQMEVDEEQTLEALVDGELDENMGYKWAIFSGGGSLSSEEGNSVTYTAPSSNANCDENPTITLSCDDEVIDSITIALNEWIGNEVAYIDHEPCIICSEQTGDCVGCYHLDWASLRLFYTCNSTFIKDFCCWWEDADEAYCILECNPGFINDRRTQAMKDGGCCPEALI